MPSTLWSTSRFSSTTRIISCRRGLVVTTDFWITSHVAAAALRKFCAGFERWRAGFQTSGPPVTYELWLVTTLVGLICCRGSGTQNGGKIIFRQEHGAGREKGCRTDALEHRRLRVGNRSRPRRQSATQLARRCWQSCARLRKSDTNTVPFVTFRDSQRARPVISSLLGRHRSEPECSDANGRFPILGVPCESACHAKDRGMHLAVAWGSGGAGRVGWRTEHAAEAGLAGADRADVGGRLGMMAIARAVGQEQASRSAAGRSAIWRKAWRGCGATPAGPGASRR